MTAGEVGLAVSILTALTGAATWWVTSRQGDRSLTANEDQAWAARQRDEITYLSAQLAACRAEGERMWGIITSLREGRRRARRAAQDEGR